jgi:hypothetical protein
VYAGVWLCLDRGLSLRGVAGGAVGEVHVAACLPTTSLCGRTHCVPGVTG